MGYSQKRGPIYTKAKPISNYQNIDKNRLSLSLTILAGIPNFHTIWS